MPLGSHPITGERQYPTKITQERETTPLGSYLFVEEGKYPWDHTPLGKDTSHYKCYAEKQTKMSCN